MKNATFSSLKEHIKNYYRGKINSASCSCFPVDSILMGYNQRDLEALPEESKLNLGCGNPLIFSVIQKGDTILDLGSGAGMDCFLAAKETGEIGRVIGVDMTEEMVLLARKNAQKLNLKQVKFIHAYIEDLPIESESVDIIISNCVINLSENKMAVFKEAYRVLKKRGRLAISDIVAIQSIPESLQFNYDLHASCSSGAESPETIEKMLLDIGFKKPYISLEVKSKKMIESWHKTENLSDYFCSARIEAEK